MLRTTLLFACLLLASPQRSDLAAARKKLAAGDAAGAAALCEELVRDHPDDGGAWYVYGLAVHQTGEWARALELHAKAAEFPGVRANASYNAACAEARLGHAEQACAWLRRALDAGVRNVGQWANDPDLASLQSDERYAALFPVGQAPGFVEPVRVLLELRGEAPGDHFGWIGRNAGDTDGDGVADLLLSAPFHARSAGKVYLYSGKTGALRWSRDGEAPGDRLGIGIERAGDVDGDGVPDQLAGASGARGTGAAYVFSGVDGHTLLTFAGEAQGDDFGRKVAGAGDHDGDGRADVIVGAPGHDGVGADSGRATVFSGADGRALYVLDGEAAGDRFGRVVDACAEGDQRLLVIGASDAGADQRGRVYVYRTGADGAHEAFRIEGEDGDRELGLMFVSVVGDVDGDGALDVYASDWQSGANGLPGSGRIAVHSGADGRRLHSWSGAHPGDGFGIGTAEAGDVDGDGCDDLLVGVWQDATGAPSGGSCVLRSGKTGEVLATYTCTTVGDTFGFDTTGLGDVDGDGAPDFLITSAASFVSGAGSGRVLVVAGPTRRE